MRQPFEDRPHPACPETARQGCAWRKAPPSCGRTNPIRCRRNQAAAVSGNPGMDFRRYYARHSRKPPVSAQKGKGPPRLPSQGARRSIPHPGKKRRPSENRRHRLHKSFRGTFQPFGRRPACQPPRNTAGQGSGREGRPVMLRHQEGPAEISGGKGVPRRTFAYLRPYRETEAHKSPHHGKSRVRIFKKAGSRSFFQHFRHGTGHVYTHGTIRCPFRQGDFSPFQEGLRVSGKKLHDDRPLSGKYLEHPRGFSVCPEQAGAADHLCMGRRSPEAGIKKPHGRDSDPRERGKHQGRIENQAPCLPSGSGT